MNTKILTLAAVAALVATPALACQCTYDPARAQAIIHDDNYALAKVFVRGVNARIGQSMLENKGPVVGGLLAPDIRAHFTGGTCGIVPQYKQTQTLLIHFDPDGTYAVVGDCDYSNVTRYLREHPEAAAGTTPGGN